MGGPLKLALILLCSAQINKVHQEYLQRDVAMRTSIISYSLVKK